MSAFGVMSVGPGRRSWMPFHRIEGQAALTATHALVQDAVGAIAGLVRSCGPTEDDPMDDAMEQAPGAHLRAGVPAAGRW